MIWTRYGRWDDAGLRVLNQYGEVIYTLPHGLHQPAVLRGAVVVSLGNLNDLAKDGGAGAVIQQA